MTIQEIENEAHQIYCKFRSLQTDYDLIRNFLSDEAIIMGCFNHAEQSRLTFLINELPKHSNFSQLDLKKSILHAIAYVNYKNRLKELAKYYFQIRFPKD